ncbi:MULTISPECIES: hypothetical protein [Microbacterium]|uniref:Uncharacterized protein n=1 Tax=Microbacterium saccharophilum TaxID=1213358 RepID=A0A7Z7CV84_9MICO|nr:MULTISPECIES: hypothetical protein [Microbacterium]SFI17865.1 hypothetical protein SAMN04487751_0127 [Microbacterium saccharophilum]
MIGAGVVLLCVGIADLIRLYAPRGWRVAFFAVAALLVLLGSAGADAAVWSFVGFAVAAVWVLSTPERRGGRAGLWPVVLVAAVCVAAVAQTGARAAQGPLGALWPERSPLGAVSLDVAVLVLGAVVFLLESGNVIVRAALRGGDVPAEEDRQALQGGRLIGPLERALVFALTLTGAFTLLAAVLAAKGIVRFPEISRDGDGGTRAEYFLVGSLVSWVTALVAAFLVWWGGV